MSSNCQCEECEGLPKCIHDENCQCVGCYVVKKTGRKWEIPYHE